MKLAKRPLLIIGVIAVIAVAYFFWRRGGEAKPEYREAIVERGQISVTVLSTGVVQPENRVDIKPPIPGRAERVMVKEGDRVRKGQTLVLMSSTERAALLDAALARGTDELKRWEDTYKPTPVLAPISGMIILRSIEPGQTFASTDSILVMSDRLAITAQVDETDLAQISVGQSVSVVLDAYPARQIPARVTKIAYEAKTVSNVTTYAITVVPEEVPEFMRSGMTANVTFKVAEKSGVLTVPAEAVKRKERARFVLVPVKDGEPSEQEIQTGLSDGKVTEVASGLAEGQKILIAKAKTAPGAKPQGSNPFSPMGGARRGGGGGGR